MHVCFRVYLIILGVDRHEKYLCPPLSLSLSPLFFLYFHFFCKETIFILFCKLRQ